MATSFNYEEGMAFALSNFSDSVLSDAATFSKFVDGLITALAQPLEKAVSSKCVTIYTDGACSGNPGPGGWGAVLICGEHRKELSGAVADATNNRMELTGAIEALSALKRPCRVQLHSDSSYLISAFNNHWIDGWKRNGWKTSRDRDVENKDLWIQLSRLTDVHDVEFVKVRGHADDELNNICDKLAVDAYRQLMKEGDLS